LFVFQQVRIDHWEPHSYPGIPLLCFHYRQFIRHFNNCCIGMVCASLFTIISRRQFLKTNLAKLDFWLQFFMVSAN
jgi:hypothetical protein